MDQQATNKNDRAAPSAVSSRHKKRHS